VSAQDSISEVFDVFLCHNSQDKQVVREIAQRLKELGIKPWLDREQIRPGTTWQKALGDQIRSIKSAAVFVGESGIGPWQDEEIQGFLNEFMNRSCAVIPADSSFCCHDAGSTVDAEEPSPCRFSHI
jgi:hypothetical protein